MRAGRGAVPALVAALLCGCALRNFSMRSLPAETPAADNAAAVQRAAQFAAQQAQAACAPSATPADLGPPLTAADVPSLQTYDPWERMNRFFYRFNARFDENLFLPLADDYRRLPSPLRDGVHHFFANLAEVVSVVNYVVQLRPLPGLRSLGRFVINSTAGIGGLLDVATAIHLRSAPTGFSQTLARYGMHPGPYLVLPILGPSTLRDGTGYFADYGTAYLIDVARLYRGNVGWALTPLNAVDVRANTSFRYYATGSPFEYDTVRFLYVRKTLIEDDRLRLWQRSGPADEQLPAGR